MAETQSPRTEITDNTAVDLMIEPQLVLLPQIPDENRLKMLVEHK